MGADMCNTAAHGVNGLGGGGGGGGEGGGGVVEKPE